MIISVNTHFCNIESCNFQVLVYSKDMIYLEAFWLLRLDMRLEDF